MTEYQVQTTHVPPVLRLIDGALYVEVIFGSETYRAPVGDGRRFFSEVIAKLVDPALLAAQTKRVSEAHIARAMATGESWVRVELVDPDTGYASPND